jgi:hypothetical protein
MTAMTKSSLSPQRRRLIELMQALNFGRVEQLEVRDGEPVLEPAPRVVREHKFGGENGPRPEASLRDFALKAPVVELLALLDELRDGTVEVLEVKHGVPFRVFVPGAGG